MRLPLLVLDASVVAQLTYFREPTLHVAGRAGRAATWRVGGVWGDFENLVYRLLEIGRGGVGEEWDDGLAREVVVFEVCGRSRCDLLFNIVVPIQLALPSKSCG